MKLENPEYSALDLIRARYKFLAHAQRHPASAELTPEERAVLPDRDQYFIALAAAKRARRARRNGART